MQADAALNAEKWRIAVPWLLALGIELALVYVVSLGDLRTQIHSFWLAVLGLSTLYGIAVLWTLRQKSGSTRTLILFALLFRLTMWHSPVSLSDDIYRYVWDGRVQMAGINPYRYAPEHDALMDLRDSAIFPKINHRQVPTIYPPLAQAFFAVIAAIEESPDSVKMGLIAFDMGLCLLLARFLTLRKMDPRRTLIYAWHPLPLVEVAGSGHIDILGLFFALAALYALALYRQVLAYALLAAATLSKLVPAFLFPFFWQHRGGNASSRLRALLSLSGRTPFLVFPIMIFLAYIPYVDFDTHTFSGLSTYLHHWHFNDLIYSLLRRMLEAFDPSAALHARWACAFLLITAIACAVRSTQDPLRAAYWSLGAYVLLSPTLHPWYLLWIMPFMPFFPSAPWLVLSGLVFLAYEVLIDYSLSGVWLEKSWVRWAQYAPFYFLLFSSFAYSRWQKIRGNATRS